MSIFCNHKWEILSETTTESQAEKILKLGLRPNVNAYNRKEITEKKLIQILTCPKCGKIKRYKAII